MSECLIFDIMGDLGHFKKFFTTSSPLTFDIPPKTALTGIIGAILGLDYKQRYELFDAKFAVKINHPLRKLYFGINWLNTKWKGKNLSDNIKQWFELLFQKSLGGGELGTLSAFTGLEWTDHSPHTQPMIEYLVEPSYRIYYSNDNPYFNQLCEMVQEHKSHYPIYMGISELLSDFQFISIANQTLRKESGIVSISSLITNEVLNTESEKIFELEEGHPIEIDNFPIQMTHPRKVLKYLEVYYSIEGYPINARVQSYAQIQDEKNKIDENIVYF